MIKKIFHNFFPAKKNPDHKKSWQELADEELAEYTQKENIDIGLEALCIADTHGSLHQKQKDLEHLININPDVIICMGDIRKDELQIIMEKKGNIPCLGIKGNHDDDNQFEDINIVDINGRIAVINGIKIAGIEGSLKYKDSMPGFTQGESIAFAQKMEQGADLLVTHAHMYRKDDLSRNEYDVHMGLLGSRQYFNKNHCINIHGHDHEIENQFPERNVYKVYGLMYLSL